MDIVVTARHCEVSDRFREHVAEKLTKLEKFDQKVIRVNVQVCKEPSVQRASDAERIELTVHSKGPVIRAEAEAGDRYGALDLAVDKLVSRLRKAADRRRVHHGRRRPTSVADATAAPNGVLSSELPNGSVALAEAERDAVDGDLRTDVGGVEAIGDGPMVVRHKVHSADPMSLEQALYEMELVGHDFFLFVDSESRCPSVVYRRRGYDYGVIRLEG